MKAGDVLFYTADAADWAGMDIERCTGSRFCHVAMVVSDTELIEAIRPRVHRAPLDVRPIAASVSPAYPSQDAVQAAVNVMALHVGAYYNVQGVSLLGLYTLLGPKRSHWLGKAIIREGAEAERSVFCSELVALALVAGGVKETLDARLSTPGDVAKLLGVV